jgi:hypothetical protein
MNTNYLKKQLALMAVLVASHVAVNQSAVAKSHYSHDVSPYSKTVRNVSGTGMEDTVESVSGCKIYVNGTEEKTLINILGLIKFRETAKCYQACGSVTFKDSKNYVLYDDEGNPMEGTQTENAKREATEVCGIHSCETKDVISSCQAYLQPYIDICKASGGCGIYSTRSKGKGPGNVYYQRPNLVDPDYPEAE